MWFPIDWTLLVFDVMDFSKAHAQQMFFRIQDSVLHENVEMRCKKCSSHWLNDVPINFSY